MDKTLHLSRPNKKLSDNERILGEMIASQLRTMGIDVVIDTSALRRVFKSAGEDKSTKGMTRFLYDSSYTVYAAEKNGKLYLDPRALDSEAAISEYARLWTRAIRTADNDKWKDIVASLQKDTTTWEACKQLCTHDTPDEIAEELICRFSGEQGKIRIEEEFQKLRKRGNASDSINYGNALQNIKRALQEFWATIARKMNTDISLQKIADTVLRDFADKANPYKKVEEAIRKRDEEYRQAVKDKDRKTAIKLINYALSENVGNGIVPYIQTNKYREVSKLAHDVKKRNPEDIKKAAKMLKPYVIKDAVLVPVPSHKGMATDTLDLAKELGKITHTPVADVLKGNSRISQYAAKKEGRPLSSEQLEIIKVKSLPKNKIPVLIDNVVNTGNTAKAAIEAVGGGVMLSLGVARYSKFGHAMGLQPIELFSKRNLSEQFSNGKLQKQKEKIKKMKRKEEKGGYKAAKTKFNIAGECIVRNIGDYTTSKGKHTTYRQLDLFESQQQTQQAAKTASLPVTSDPKKYQQMRKKLEIDDNTILLFQEGQTIKGHFMDAERLMSTLNIPSSRPGFVEIQEANIDRYLPVLIREGFRVAIANEEIIRKRLEEKTTQNKTQNKTIEKQREETKPVNTELLDLRLRELKEGEVCNIERRFTADNSVILLNGKNKVESHADVAYIFRSLEDKAIEHSFLAFIKNGQPVTVHIGMGGTDMTIVDLSCINALMENIKPEKIYFIHNHPSGNLIPSKPDKDAFKEFRNIVSGSAEIHGIIIDTYNHEFTMFDEHGKIETEKMSQKTVEKGEKLQVYAFDKKVFREDYKPEQMYTAQDIAGYIAALRLGEKKKIGYIVLDRSNKVNGNLLLPYKDAGEITKKTIREMLKNTTLMGGRQIILYGSGADNQAKINEIAKDIKKLSGNHIKMTDAVSTSQEGDYYSLHEQGLLQEDDLPYNQRYHGDINAIRKDIIDNIKKKGTSPRAIAYMEQLKDIEIIPRIGSAKGGQRIVGGSINGKAVPYAMATAEDTRSYDRMRKTLLKNGAARTLFEKTFAPMLADIIIKKIRPDLAREEEQAKKYQHSR